MRGKFLPSVILIVALTLLCSVTAGAEEKKQTKKDYEAYDLGEVVVNATMPQPEVTTTTVVTAEDIKATNSHTVAEALSHVPGLRISTGAKNHASVTINGFDQSRVLVLIDGVPYYETKYGTLDLNVINTDIVAKIEIIRGAPSVLYGANAEAGVINIITRKATETPYTSASFEMSQNNTYRTSATNGMKTGIFSYWMNYTFEKSNGWDLSGDYKPKPGTLVDSHTGTTVTTRRVFEDGGQRDNSDERMHKLWGKFGIDRSPDSQYFVNLHYLTSEMGVPSNVVSNNVFSPPVFSQFYADRIPEYDNWGIDLDGRQRLTDKIVTKGKLYYHYHNDSLYSYLDPSFNTVLAMSHYKDYTLGGSLAADYQVVPWNAVRASIHYSGDSHQETANENLPYAKSFSYTGSVGLENEFTRIKNLSIIAGLSYDWFEVTTAQKNNTNSSGNLTSQSALYTPTDEAVNGMIGANYTFSDSTKVYASFARKSRFPTLNDLYNNVNGGDPHLASEKARNYTIGASRKFGNLFKTDISAYWYDVTDKISTAGSGSNKRTINIGQVRILGTQLGAEFYPIDKLMIRADYTCTDAEDISSNATTSNVQGVPKHIFHLLTQYNVPRVNTIINADASYMARVYTNLPPGSSGSGFVEVGDYVLVNLKITQPFAKHYEVYAQVRNLFDKDYETDYGYPGLGRSFWAGLAVKF